MFVGAGGDTEQRGRDVLGFADAVDQLVPAEAHDGAHAEQEDAGAEASGGEVALETSQYGFWLN